MDLEMLGVDPKPIFRGITTRLRVTALSLPRSLWKPAQEGDSIGADGVDCGQGGLERMLVVVEGHRPASLVVAEDERVLLADQIADAGGGIGLGVRAVDDDLVGRPLARLGAPLTGLGGHGGEDGTQSRRARGVLLD